MELKRTVREGKPSDLHKIVALYRTVASCSGGIARENNKRAIEFYKKLGLNIEGRLEIRICDKNGKLKADIPMGWILSACMLQVQITEKRKTNSSDVLTRIRYLIFLTSIIFDTRPLFFKYDFRYLLSRN